MIKRAGASESVLTALRGSVRRTYCCQVRTIHGSAERASLHQKLANYYVQKPGKGGETVEDAQEQSRHTLRWLEEHVASQGHQGSTKHRQVQDLVRRMTDKDEPLAYLLGENHIRECGTLRGL